MRSSLGSIQKLGSDYYKVTATVGIDAKTGKQQRRSKRVHGSRREAERELAKMLTAEVQADVNKTVASVTSDYLETKEGAIKKATFLDYKRLCEPIYNAPFASCPIKDIAKRESGRVDRI